MTHSSAMDEPATRDSPVRHTLHDARDWAFAAGVALLLGVLFQLGVPLRGSFGANVTGDEPFYLLTTESLLSDGDFDLTNQYATEAYRRFFDGDGPLWYQSVPTGDGRLLSPHNIGLSVLVLPAYAVGGVAWVKAFLALLGGLTAGWTYLLCRRALAGRRGSLLAVLLLGISAPFFVYTSQIYPEMPAALLTTIVVWLNLGPRGSIRRGVGVAAVLAVLMWLGAKYAPVAGVLGGLTLLRLTWHG
ncbi:MAG: hypothetical protein GEU73_15120, partial [Chloroflexi bacterium]|nr:hypothetical protein [Chloroflexota bacterium]